MAEVRVGDKAPDVLLVGGPRQRVRLSDLFGQPVVLAFFPGAFTGVCTREMCTFRDSLNVFTDAGARVVGISGDTPYAKRAGGEQPGLPSPLLSDFTRRAVMAFGVPARRLKSLR